MGIRSVIPLSAVALLLGACVDVFSGSSVQINFLPGTLAPARPGAMPAPDQPPANTYMTLYAVDHVRDENGTIVQAFLFPVHDFELRPVIDAGSPCFIDLEGTRFPGVHVTKFVDKVKEATGISDPLKPPPGAAQGDRIDTLTAFTRNSNLGALQGAVKAVTSFSTFQYGAVASTCVEDEPSVNRDLIPPPQCTGTASNENRLRVCKEQWRQDPEFYEGSDKVFTLPLNGRFYGVVEGMNPINMGFLGGSSFFVDEVLDHFEGYAIHWQYKDLDGDGGPDYPAGVEASDTGFLYMSGIPERRTRGVLNVRMVNGNNANIAAEMAIIPGLAEDDVNF